MGWERRPCWFALAQSIFLFESYWMGSSGLNYEFVLPGFVSNRIFNTIQAVSAVDRTDENCDREAFDWS